MSTLFNKYLFIYSGIYFFQSLRNGSGEENTEENENIFTNVFINMRV